MLKFAGMRRLGLLATVLAGLLAALPLPGLTSSAAAQQGAGIRQETTGFWNLVCRMKPGSKNEICIAEQSVSDESRPDISITVIFRKLLDSGAIFLDVQVPLGILLPTGLGLKIDDKDVGNAPFILCRPEDGCVAEVIVKDELLEAFKKGKSALFIIFLSPKEGIGIPINLDGLAAVLAKIK